ncbi:MAG: potassium transporter TrkG [Bacteroidota bacterium]|nr:potassium transporter TrkG [Bacteroidota bacterium]
MNTRNQIERYIFLHQERILKILRFYMLIASLLVFAMMVYRYGFNHSQENIDLILFSTRFFYLIFITTFLIRLFIEKEKKTFLVNNAFEAILIILVVYDGISYFLLGHPVLENLIQKLNVPNYRAIYDFFIQFFLLIFVAIELIKSINTVYTTKLKPTTLFIFSFILLIFLGSLLLSLPGFNYTGKPLAYIDALFTSTSACCVTGLVVENTATFFNLKGQIIILFLIQLGGIGILTFASFFASFIKKGIGVKHQLAMNQLLDSENLSGTTFLLKRILIMTFFIEFVGVMGIYFLWGDYQFANEGDKIYHSIFHSISSFCNAGFSTLELGFETPLVNELYMLHIFMGFIIIMGGLGFPVIRDVFSPIKMRQRLKEPWKPWSLSTKIAIYSSLILLIFGTVTFYLLHVQYMPSAKSPIAKFATSFFQSVNTRTSGFNSINMSELPNTLIMISMFLMFIGASSASTGGGIKTSTFVIMMIAVIGTIRGKREMTLGNRTIGAELVYKAFAVVVFSGLFVLTTITVLSFTEYNIPLANIAYESISAFATVGLSTGITPNLSTAGKTMIVIAMFVGRVGVLSLAFSLSSKAVNTSSKYAKTHLMIG